MDISKRLGYDHRYPGPTQAEVALFSDQVLHRRLDVLEAKLDRLGDHLKEHDALLLRAAELVAEGASLMKSLAERMGDTLEATDA